MQRARLWPRTDEVCGVFSGSAGILPATGRRPVVVQAIKMPALPGRRKDLWLIGRDDGARSPGSCIVGIVMGRPI